ncbi:isochorismatase family protein [Paenarthrobacter nitroguajacolicus]|uniref:isochorismatase family protein n=1 Tax=Paenarthrobacter nitroguajacolicus TaxID=211146 RepID=UPI00343E58DC
MSDDTAWADEVHERYRNSGLAGRLQMGDRPALVITDLQTGFTDPQCGPGFDLDDVVAGTARLLAYARRQGLPIYFTTIVFDQEQLTSSVWLVKMPVMNVLSAGSGWERIDPRVAPLEGEVVVTKQAASGFAGTDLADRLKADGVNTVILCGATTSGCVRATAVDACAHSLPTFVVRECVGDREHRPHESALLDLDAKYADVVSLEETLRMIGATP